MASESYKRQVYDSYLGSIRGRRPGGESGPARGLSRAAAIGPRATYLKRHVERHFPAHRSEFTAAALAPGGWVQFHLPNAEVLFGARIRCDDPTDGTAFTPRAIARLLVPAGFDDRQVLEDRPAVRRIRSAACALVWRLVRGLLRLALAAQIGDGGRSAVFSQNLLATGEKRR